VTDWEVVVLDDGSCDKTADIIEALARDEKRLRVVKHARNEGLFRSFDDVQREARGTHVYSTGSDGQWPATNLTTMLRTLVECDADLVVGVRPNRHEIYTTWRKIVSCGFRLLPRLLFGTDIYDPGSVKLGRRELFQCHLISRSPFIEAERIIRAIRAGYRVEFVPIEFLPRTGGTARGAKWSYILGSLRDGFRCFWHYRLCRGSSTMERKTQ
jgi:glycosyltransferase involved in cell wall biosynthesis